MAARKDWFEVDKDGLGRVLARKGVEFAIGELLQNAWDADGTTRVDVTLVPVPHSPSARLTVEDDSPAGFADLSHSYRLFGGSTKGKDPTRRGKFDLGEKLVFALAREATVVSTTGTVTFDAKGRHIDRRATRAFGSRVEALLPMTRDDLARCEKFIRQILPPAHIRTTFNGVAVLATDPIHTVEAVLETEVADDDGRLRKTYRNTQVRIHPVAPGDKGRLYELGLPVQETGDDYHWDVQQRVPVGFDRDAVSLYYLRCIRAAALPAVAATTAAPEADWVTDAVESGQASAEVVKTVIQRRFGERAVAADPTDPEAVSKATAHGYTVVHGGSLPAGVWEQVRKHDLLPRAGRLFPTHPKDATEADAIPEAEWTDGQKRIARYVRRLGTPLLGFEPAVCFKRHKNGAYLATWSPENTGTLTFYVEQLGAEWFKKGINEDVIELVVHEFGHHGPGCDNHLSEAYHTHLCKLAVKLRNQTSLEWS